MAEKGASGSGFPAQKYQEIFISQGWPILLALCQEASVDKGRNASEGWPSGVKFWPKIIVSSYSWDVPHQLTADICQTGHV